RATCRTAAPARGRQGRIGANRTLQLRPDDESGQTSSPLPPRALASGGGGPSPAQRKKLPPPRSALHEQCEPTLPTASRGEGLKKAIASLAEEPPCGRAASADLSRTMHQQLVGELLAPRHAHIRLV